MLRIKVALILILFFTSAIQAATSAALKSYYCTINIAELSILDSNYRQAMIEYESATKTLGRLYVKDRYNYAIVCALEGYYKKCTEQLHFLISKGASISTFKKNIAFRNYFNSSQGRRLNKRQARIKPTYNLTYRKKLDSLVYMDQLFRTMPGGYSVYGDTIRKIDSSNAVAFNQLVLLYGFPTEDLVGIDTSKFNRPIYDLIILHNRKGSKFRSFDFSSLMQTAMDSGWIEIHTAADYVEMSMGKFIWGVEEIRPLRCIYDSINMPACYSNGARPDYSIYPIGFYAMEDSVESLYNAHRSEYCLEQVNDARRKALFQLSDPRFDFTFSKLDIFVFTEKPQYLRMMERVIFITQ